MNGDYKCPGCGVDMEAPEDLGPGDEIQVECVCGKRFALAACTKVLFVPTCLPGEHKPHRHEPSMCGLCFASLGELEALKAEMVSDL